MPHYFETHRTTVTPAQLDHLGHMNVQYYTAAVNAGAITLAARLGLTLEEIKRRRIALAVVRTETDYLREAREGEELVLHSAVERVGGRSLRFLHRLSLAADGTEVARMVAIAVPLHLDTRSATDIPADVRAAAVALSQGALGNGAPDVGPPGAGAAGNGRP